MEENYLLNSIDVNVQRGVIMKFADWKEQFGHIHMTDSIKTLLAELKTFEHDVEAQASARFKELKEFEEKVEKMLVAEWEVFLAKIEGHHGDYN